MKWAKDKWNVSVVKQTNNQTPTLGPAHEWRHAHMISEGLFIRREANSYSCRPKKPTTRSKIKSLKFQRVGPKNGQPEVKGLWHFVVLSGM
jgi:hypothetical protein